VNVVPWLVVGAELVAVVLVGCAILGDCDRLFELARELDDDEGVEQAELELEQARPYGRLELVVPAPRLLEPDDDVLVELDIERLRRRS
jgi:hypothetical protein